MELREAINKRRSIRRFCNKKVERQDIEEIILSASYAPSACDNQSWKFIVIDDSNLKQRIVDEGGAQFIKDAPIGILVIYDNRTDNPEYQDYIQSASAAIQNMLLTATSLGIGSCWICQLPHKNTLRNLFNIPISFDPIAYIALGYYEHDVKPRPRKNTLQEIVSFNGFDFKVVQCSRLQLELKRLTRSIYFSLPLFLKKRLRPIAEKFVRKFD